MTPWQETSMIELIALFGACLICYAIMIAIEGEDR